MASSGTSPQAIAELGEEIYARQFKDEYQQTSLGKFVAIDGDSETPYLADTPEAALAAGHSSSPRGRFHVIAVR